MSRSSIGSACLHLPELCRMQEALVRLFHSVTLIVGPRLPSLGLDNLTAIPIIQVS